MILGILKSSTPSRALIIAGALTLFGAAGAGAEGADRLGQDNDWAAFAAENNGGKTCYTFSTPKESTPKNVRRDPVYFFVTFRPKDKIRNQVSVIIGYPFKKGSTASVEIGASKFTLFTDDNKAWIDDIAEQDKLVAAMKAGATMTVNGISHRGTKTSDKYSLSGISASLGRIAKACP